MKAHATALSRWTYNLMINHSKIPIIHRTNQVLVIIGPSRAGQTAEYLRWLLISHKYRKATSSIGSRSIGWYSRFPMGRWRGLSGGATSDDSLIPSVDTGTIVCGGRAGSWTKVSENFDGRPYRPGRASNSHRPSYEFFVRRNGPFDEKEGVSTLEAGEK
jgi:hypothetical protein